jgi:hypothetical protein
MHDDELGSRIEEALRLHADDAPRARTGDLAWTARRRLRRRRRAVIGAAALTVGMVALGSAWSSLGGSGYDDSAGSTDSGQAEAPVPLPSAQDGARAAQADGWRWESFGGIEVSVPANWTYGVSGAPWCIDDRGQANGEVGRPGPVRSIGCPDVVPVGVLGEHVWLSRTTEGVAKSGRTTQDLGSGWVRDVVKVGSVSIEVQTRASPSVRSRILSSVRQVSTDLNGCPADHPVTASGWTRPARGPDWSTAVTGVSICRYQTDPTGGHPLIASVREDAADASAVLDAIRAAPAGEGPDDPTGAPDYLGSDVTVLRFHAADGIREIYLRYAGTKHNGFDNGTDVRRLTRAAVAFMTGPLVVNGGPGATMDLLPRR